MPRILCLGMSALDAIYRVPAIPTTPTKVLATGFTECGGGMAANASVAVARLGGQASYWGRLGADDLGARILAQLAAEGVDVSTVRRIPGCVSPSAAILVADDGERLVCAYNDPLLDPDASWLPLERIADFDAVLTDVRWPAGAGAVLDAAAALGRPAVLDGDVGPRDALLDLARARHACHLLGARTRTGRADRCSGRRARKTRALDPRSGRRYARSRRLPLARWRSGAVRSRAPHRGRRYAGGRRRLARRIHARVGGRTRDRCRGPLRQRGGRDQVHAHRRSPRRTEPRRGVGAARGVTSKLSL